MRHKNEAFTILGFAALILLFWYMVEFNPFHVPSIECWKDQCAPEECAAFCKTFDPSDPMSPDSKIRWSVNTAGIRCRCRHGQEGFEPWAVPYTN